jgi:translation initiation factor 1
MGYHLKLKSFSDLNKILPASEQPDQTVPIGTHDGKGKAVRVLLDTKGRKGKRVTIISGFEHNPATMKEIATILKEHCATGGTVKNGNIELQGDQRERATVELQRMNYVVKRA